MAVRLFAVCRILIDKLNKHNRSIRRVNVIADVAEQFSSYRTRAVQRLCSLIESMAENHISYEQSDNGNK